MFPCFLVLHLSSTPAFYHTLFDTEHKSKACDQELKIYLVSLLYIFRFIILKVTLFLK
jgi:hypothetical protein